MRAANRKPAWQLSVRIRFSDWSGAYVLQVRRWWLPFWLDYRFPEPTFERFYPSYRQAHAAAYLFSMMTGAAIQVGVGVAWAADHPAVTYAQRVNRLRQ